MNMNASMNLLKIVIQHELTLKFLFYFIFNMQSGLRKCLNKQHLNFDHWREIKVLESFLLFLMFPCPHLSGAFVFLRKNRAQKKNYLKIALHESLARFISHVNGKSFPNALCNSRVFNCWENLRLNILMIPKTQPKKKKEKSRIEKKFVLDAF